MSASGKSYADELPLGQSEAGEFSWPKVAEESSWGFAAIIRAGWRFELGALFVEAEVVGQRGSGVMVEHVRRSKGAGAKSTTSLRKSHAEGFYLHAGSQSRHEAPRVGRLLQ